MSTNRADLSLFVLLSSRSQQEVWVLGGRKWLTCRGKGSYLERLRISLHVLEILGERLVDLGTSFLYVIFHPGIWKFKPQKFKTIDCIERYNFRNNI